MLKVSDVMTRELVCIKPEARVSELSQLLSRSGISGVPVVGSDGKPVGVVSQTDIARASNPELTVAEIMTPFVHSTTEDATIMEVSDLMLNRMIHRVPVMRGDEVVGLVSSLDLIRGLREQMILIIDGATQRP